MGILKSKDKDKSSVEEKEVEIGSLSDLPREQQTPASKRYCPVKEQDIPKLMDKFHPVHKIPVEKQIKMREKGVNPVLKAEMDEMMKGQGGFWTKVGMTSFGGGICNGLSG